MFAYCNDNPVNLIDTSGDEPISITISAIISGVAILLLTAAAYSSTPAGQRGIQGFVSSVVDSYNTVKAFATDAVATVKNVREKLENRKAQTYSVYFLEDDYGIIRYVGRVTDVGYNSRMAYHKETKGYLPSYRISGLSYAEARGLEEIGMIECHTLNPGQPGYNQIHGIGERNINGSLYMSSALSKIESYIQNKAEQFLLNLLE